MVVEIYVDNIRFISLSNLDVEFITIGKSSFY